MKRADWHIFVATMQRHGNDLVRIFQINMTSSLVSFYKTGGFQFLDNFFGWQRVKFRHWSERIFLCKFLRSGMTVLAFPLFLS